MDVTQYPELSSHELIAHGCYIVSVILFMLGIMRLSKVRTARSGNLMAASAMLLAVIGQFIELSKGELVLPFIIVGLLVGGSIGGYLAIARKMTEMPELVALFNGFGGLASTFVSLAMYAHLYHGVPEGESLTALAGAPGMSSVNAMSLMLAIIVGNITFTGSIVAYGKLSDKWGWEIKIAGRKLNQPIVLPGRHAINSALLLGSLILAALVTWSVGGGVSVLLVILICAATLVLGFGLVLAIGGGDMPVVISLLNSYSGVAAAMAGFALNSPVLIVSGSMVGAAGLILTQIMCKAMNRSLSNVLFGGFGDTGTGGGGGGGEYTNVRSSDAESAAMMFADAQSLIVVPGYGMAVAQAQHAVRELGDAMSKRGCLVRYAVHPVAGRMPGHMNVLLAEANVPYDLLVEMEDINKDFKDTDVVLVIGANDVVNPVALTDPESPIYGMPILNVIEARAVYTIKRSLNPGFAGIKNELFEAPNNEMIYGDAKKVVEDLVTALAEV